MLNLLHSCILPVFHPESIQLSSFLTGWLVNNLSVINVGPFIYERRLTRTIRERRPPIIKKKNGFRITASESMVSHLGDYTSFICQFT